MSAAARANRWVKVLGVTLALLNGVLWFCTPAIRGAVVEARAADLPARDRPTIINGAQELLVYFDSWLARSVFPVVFTFGLAAIPFLRKPDASHAGAGPGWAFAILVGGLLLAFEAVWLFLTGVGLFLRGPNWGLFWPGEAWDQGRFVPLGDVNLSDYFWLGLLGQSTDKGWLLRELPGLLLLGVYFLAGALIGRMLYRATQRTTPCWRWIVLVVLVQVAALVPFKMIGRWVFNLKYLVFIPEYHVNV
jgi:hypothetical protein